MCGLLCLGVQMFVILMDKSFMCVQMNNSPLLCVYLGRGFCFFNSVAITAKLLQQKLGVGKILIIDWVSF